MLTHMAKLSQATCVFVEALIAGTNPEHTTLVFIKRPDPVTAQALPIEWIVLDSGEIVRFRIEAVEPAVQGSGPECPGTIDINRPDRITPKAGVLLRIVTVPAKGFRIGIEPVDAAAKGANPQGTILTLSHAEHIGMAQAPFPILTGTGLIVNETIVFGIVPVQAGLGPDPDTSRSSGRACDAVFRYPHPFCR